LTGSDGKGLDPSTLAVHLGRPAPAPGAPVSPPVTLTATYRATTAGSPYGRDANATWEAFEAVLGGLEGGTALAFASGMGAIAAVAECLPVGARVVLPTDAYQGTRLLLQEMAASGRVALTTVDIADTDAVVAACSALGAWGAAGRGGSGAPFGAGGLLWLESPTNPLVKVAELEALSAGAHRAGLSVAADNTFATPLLQRPLDLGAEVVVHSVTKFLAGHSDVVMGVAVTRDPALVGELTRRRSLRGAIPGPFETLLALRGVRTLAVRLERAQASAGELAVRLSAHHDVTGVRYPGLPGDAGYQRARRQMTGAGTVLSFEVEGGAERAEAVCQAVRLITPATSLGGVETLIERRGRYQAEAHLPPALLRLSVGLEHVEDLWSDLVQALAATQPR
jgi:cystathionine gamma-synthase